MGLPMGSLPEKFKPRPYQLAATDVLRDNIRAGHLRQMLVSPTGSGKCLALGTQVLMHDGTSRAVETISESDLLMGPDSKPRRVLSISRGYGPMVEIRPTKGGSWGCNDEHILTLVKTNEHKDPKRRQYESPGDVIDISVNEWDVWSRYRKHIHKLFRVAVDFPDAQNLSVHPYLLGLLLGDGGLTQTTAVFSSSDREIVEAATWLGIQHGVNLRKAVGDNVDYTLPSFRGRPHTNPLVQALRDLGLMGHGSATKFIPRPYKIGSRAQRMEILAGLMDSDGSLGSNCFDYLTKSSELASGVLFVARSLGFAAYQSTKYDKTYGEYYRISISGDVDLIPTRVPRKQATPRSQKKDVLRTGFTVEKMGDGDYYGFTLDGDGHFLLADFTVTHNTLEAGMLIHEALNKNKRSLFVADRIPLIDQTSMRFHEMGIPHGVIQGANTERRWERVLICSIQTLERREYYPDADLIFIDEAHSMRKGITTLIQKVSVPVIGMTATPFTSGLGKLYSKVVNLTTTDDLLNTIDPQTGRSYLAPLRVYAAQEIDMMGAKTNPAGEWLDREVEERGSYIIGDAVSEWVEKTNEVFGGPVKTLVRGSTIAHVEDICKAYQNAGYDFRPITAYTSRDESNRLIDDFKAGKFFGLASVSKLEKGFDVPDILCLVDQRPLRKSLTSEIQFLGRGMRPSPYKDFVLVLDHTANYVGWQQDILDFFARGVDALDEGKAKGKTRNEKPRDSREYECAGCGYVMTPGEANCIACGRERPKRESGLEIRPGRMEEVTASNSREWSENNQWTWAQMCGVAQERYEGDTERQIKLARAQYKTLYGDWPPREWGFPEIDNPDNRVRRKVLQQLKAFRQRRQHEAS